MSLVPFAEYRPDVSDLLGQFSKVISNVVPRADGYGPFPSFNALSAALPATCRGYFYARNNDGSITIFAATSTRLWKMSNTDFTWVPVSKVSALTSISNASPAVLSLTAHGLSVGDAIVLSTTGSLPTGLTVGTVYYVISAGFGANSFEVSATLGGAAINTSSAGSGTHSFTAQYSGVPSGDQWQFVQFNNFVFAVQINTAPQVFDLTSSTAFADLGGSPPQARYIAVVNRFLVLSGLGSGTPYRIQWSGLNATTTWTSGVNSSDFQDFPDGGIVRTVGGGEYGIVYQDSSLRRMTFAPGTSYVFQLDRISDDKGILAPLSLVRAGSRMFYLGNDGFQKIEAGGYPIPIGKERIDRTVMGEIDTANLQLCIGASDPNSTRVFWCYKSTTGAAGNFDRIVIYDYALDRWTPVTISGEYIATLGAPGLTLENLDSISSSIDALTFSLDDVSTAALSKFSSASTAHKIGFFSGSSMEATLDTPEQNGQGKRIFVRAFRPITDAPTVYGSCSQRDNAQTTPTYTTEDIIDQYGQISQRVDTRYSRGQIRIPAGTVWTYASGIEPDFRLGGEK
jgi:hypothetical protein